MAQHTGPSTDNPQGCLSNCRRVEATLGIDLELAHTKINLEAIRTRLRDHTSNSRVVSDLVWAVRKYVYDFVQTILNPKPLRRKQVGEHRASSRCSAPADSSHASTFTRRDRMPIRKPFARLQAMPFSNSVFAMHWPLGQKQGAFRPSLRVT